MIEVSLGTAGSAQSGSIKTVAMAQRLQKKQLNFDEIP
jgi:hypothetical protein